MKLKLFLLALSCQVIHCGLTFASEGTPHIDPSGVIGPSSATTASQIRAQQERILRESFEAIREERERRRLAKPSGGAGAPTVSSTAATAPDLRNLARSPVQGTSEVAPTGDRGEAPDVVDEAGRGEGTLTNAPAGPARLVAAVAVLLLLIIAGGFGLWLTKRH